MRIYADIQVTQRAVQSTTCDGCGHFEHGEPDGWVHLTSQHEDWGVNSGDSHTEKDACCAMCLQGVLRQIVKAYDESTNPTLAVWLSELPYAVVLGLGGI